MFHITIQSQWCSLRRSTSWSLQSISPWWKSLVKKLHNGAVRKFFLFPQVAQPEQIESLVEHNFEKKKDLSKRMTFSTSGAKRALNWWNAASFLACCSSWILNHFANSPSSTSIFFPRDWNATLAYSGNEEAFPARFPTTTCPRQQQSWYHMGFF